MRKIRGKRKALTTKSLENLSLLSKLNLSTKSHITHFLLFQFRKIILYNKSPIKNVELFRYRTWKILNLIKDKTISTKNACTNVYEMQLFSFKKYAFHTA